MSQKKYCTVCGTGYREKDKIPYKMKLKCAGCETVLDIARTKCSIVTKFRNEEGKEIEVRCRMDD